MPQFYVSFFLFFLLAGAAVANDCCIKYDSLFLAKNKKLNVVFESNAWNLYSQEGRISPCEKNDSVNIVSSYLKTTYLGKIHVDTGISQEMASLAAAEPGMDICAGTTSSTKFKWLGLLKKTVLQNNYYSLDTADSDSRGIRWSIASQTGPNGHYSLHYPAVIVLLLILFFALIAGLVVRLKSRFIGKFYPFFSLLGALTIVLLLMVGVKKFDPQQILSPVFDFNFMILLVACLVSLFVLSLPYLSSLFGASGKNLALVMCSWSAVILFFTAGIFWGWWPNAICYLLAGIILFFLVLVPKSRTRRATTN